MSNAPTPHPRPSQDAAIVLVLADAAVNFAGSPEDEAERWLRLFRLHGQVGCALQAIGVPEGPLASVAEAAEQRQWRLRKHNESAVDIVSAQATQLARERGASLVSTVDLLFAVLAVYGPAFDRALYSRGTSRDELLDRIAAQAQASSSA